ncbi:hypothetical protein BP5796_04211 [Coleophoma crateriformis]|uniref:Spherulin 4-like cell surface protein n=1 Tax=Coleophoma crateriformis TaxID=565419 RepID=A0A3D8SHU6_9HELO|nr:hypothetical protein BP5796_04211 [Coleophoma crateriformis]
MFQLLTLFLLVLQLVGVEARPSILFPLYIYPSPGAWNPIYWALGNNTAVTFKIVINPNSGPPNAKLGAADLASYVSAVSVFKKYPNALTYGYVDTNYPNRNDSDIVADIDSWKYYSPALVPTGGIFFDDVHTMQVNGMWQLNNVAAYARADNFTDVIFNPGAAPAFPDPRYPNTQTVSLSYQYANRSLVYENFWGAATGPAVASNVSGFIQANNHGVAYTKLQAAVYQLPGDAVWNNITGGCAKTKSGLCNFTNSFTGVVDSLYLSDLAYIDGVGGNYSTFPNNFMAWAKILNGTA